MNMNKCPDCKNEVPELFYPFGDAKYTAVCSDCQLEAESMISEHEEMASWGDYE